MTKDEERQVAGIVGYCSFMLDVEIPSLQKHLAMTERALCKIIKIKPISKHSKKAKEKE